MNLFIFSHFCSIKLFSFPPLKVLLVLPWIQVSRFCFCLSVIVHWNRLLQFFNDLRQMLGSSCYSQWLYFSASGIVYLGPIFYFSLYLFVGSLSKTVLCTFYAQCFFKIDFWIICLFLVVSVPGRILSGCLRVVNDRRELPITSFLWWLKTRLPRLFKSSVDIGGPGGCATYEVLQ